MTALARSVRVRRTWWTDAVDRAGCTAYTVYNRMMLPASFRGTDVDAAHLKRAVQVWDVAKRKLLLSVPMTYDTLYGGSWSPDGKLIAFGCADNS